MLLNADTPSYKSLHTHFKVLDFEYAGRTAVNYATAMYGKLEDFNHYDTGRCEEFTYRIDGPASKEAFSSHETASSPTPILAPPFSLTTLSRLFSR